MTTNLADDVRQAIEDRDGGPVYFVDATTGASYVLMRAEKFEKISAIAGTDEFEAMYALVTEIEPDDWEDVSHYDRKP